MDPILARDYECKLNSLKLLKQALDNQLISWHQYVSKQEEFLELVDFNPPYGPLDIASKVAIKVQEMEDDLERGSSKGSKRSLSSSYLERAKKPRRIANHADDEKFQKLHELCSVSYDSPYEYGNGAKYSTFSEFIYDAVRALGGTAFLQTIYKYAYDHQSDIDGKYAYRFRDNEYKSNVRSTLHNTGAFSKMPTGEWTITGKLKTRKY